MNILKARYFLRSRRAWLAVLALLLAATAIQAAETPQAARFLLIFETSPTLKKNLPAIRQTLAKLFSSNLQNELKQDDDVAVWTVDKTLHAGTFPMESWTPMDAESYTEQLQDFLGHQNFTRHASLGAIQPPLNHLVKNSERLTVLIFGDSQCRLAGTPYDVGVNEIITNTAARVKGGPVPLVLVLRSYHGAYLGCSVNRTMTLSFPPFPPPPAPAPPPVATKPVVSKPVTAPAPPPAPKPVVPPVPALVIVGTNYGTNAAVLTSTAPAVVRPPAPPPGTNLAVSVTNAPAAVMPVPVLAPAPAPALAVVATVPPSNPPPVRPPAPVLAAIPAPAPLLVPPKPAAPEPAVETPPTLVLPANPPLLAPSNTLAAAAEKPAADNGYGWKLPLGAGTLAAAAGLVAWLMFRRRPHSSLITSSMQGDPRLPPRK